MGRAVSAPTTTEQIAGVMVQIAAEDLGRVTGALLRGDVDRADNAILDAIRQLEAARRMIK